MALPEEDAANVKLNIMASSAGVPVGTSSGARAGLVTANRPPTISSFDPNVASPQVAGTSVTWSVQASDPDGDQIYYRYWVRGPSTGGAWSDRTGWVTGNNWIWTTSPADVGSNEIRVWIRDGKHASPDAFDANSAATFVITSLTPPPPPPPPPNRSPMINSFTPNVASPQVAGTSITWSVQASDPDGDQIYYRYWVRGPSTGGAWSDRTGWVTGNNWIWTTSPADVGSNEISIWVRDGKHKGPETFDANSVAAFVITAPAPPNRPPTIVGFGPDSPSPQLPGAWVRWDTRASDPDQDVILYRYWLRGPSTGGIWVDQTGGWTRNRAWIWRTTDVDVGESQVRVAIRDGKHAGEQSWDDMALTSYIIARPSPPPDQPPVISALQPSLSSPQFAGSVIRWAASAYDSEGEPILYKFMLNGPSTGGAWRIVQDWSLANTWDWVTSSADLGQSQVQVQVRDGRHAGAQGWDDQAGASFAIISPVPANRPPLITKLQPDKPIGQVAGTTVTWRALASDPDGDSILYRFALSGPSTGNSLQVVSDWSAINAWTWRSRPDGAGDYTVYVYVRDGRHAGPGGYDSVLSVPYRLLPPTTQINPRKLTFGLALKDRPSLASTGDGFVIAYQSWEAGLGSNGDIMLQKFDPNWNSLKTVSVTSDRAYQDMPSVLFTGELYYVTYTSALGGNLDIFLATYDRSLKLLGTRQLTNLPTDQSSPSLIQLGDQFFLAYQSWESGTDGAGNIFITRFDQNWNPLMTIQVTDQSYYIDRPTLLFADGSFYVAYASSDGGRSDVFVSRLDMNLNHREVKRMTFGQVDHDYPTLNWMNGQFILLYSATAASRYDLFVERFYRNWSLIDRSDLAFGPGDQSWPSVAYSPQDGLYWVAYVSQDLEGQNIYVAPVRLETGLGDCQTVASFSSSRANAPYIMTAAFYNNYGELSDPMELSLSWTPQDAVTGQDPGMKRISSGIYQLSSRFGSPGDKLFQIMANIDDCISLRTVPVRVN